MTRRSFLMRYVRDKAPDEQTAARYLFHWHTGHLYRNPGTFPRIASGDLFGNDHPLEIDIGCGTGEFLCARAAGRPECNFVGLDINLKSIHVAVAQAAAAGLDNIKFIKAPMQFVYPLLMPNSIHMVYLHFPDPCLHPKYRKRRLFNQTFLDNIYCALVAGGRLNIVTDKQELFISMLGLLEKDARFERAHQERYLSGFEPEVKSRYQSYWEQLGAPIYRFEAQKKA